MVALERVAGRSSAVRAELLPALAELVAASARRPIPEGKPIVGGSAFTHESGIHVSGLLHDPETYEALRPEHVGRTRRIVLGKHSGRGAVAHELHSLGIQADSDCVAQVLDLVRSRAMATRKAVGPHELRELYVQATRPLPARVAAGGA